jgi:transcriptional regulator with XRE-family HTH domain
MLTAVKTAERLEARRIRREEGASMKTIATRLGVSVSSVSLWVRDIELSPSQRAALRNKISGGWSANAIAARRRRRLSQEGGRALVRDADPLFVAGIMLFWAEGAKARNEAGIVNSDPELVRFFVRFLRRFYGVPDDRFRVACNLFADHLARQREIEQFWLDTLELPQSCLRKSMVNIYSRYSQRKRRGRLPYGTCKIVVCDTAVVQSIYGAIQEYAGFDRPEWLG